MKTLHFDCSAGISGDMTLGALVELGVDPHYLEAELRKLSVEGWSLDFCRDERCGITGTRAVVTLHSDQGGSHAHGHGGQGEHHHEHEHHGHEHEGGHTHEHGSSHEHKHDHEHEHGGQAEHHHHEHEHEHHGHGTHEHRRWKDIRAMIEGSSLKKSVITRAVDIFTRIAEAEAGVHGMEPSEVAFHEVGALDSIIDIVGAAICLDVLGPERITASPVELGGGSVACAHGVLPVPAPATLALCRGFPVTTGNFDKEMTTPTGAAILASCVDEFVTRGSFVELQTAYGIGTRKLARPNVLRVSWREEGAFSLSGEAWNRETLFQLESSLDDMTGEALAFLMERLFEAGALDVNFIPCTMKKSRPAVIVTALCRPDVLGRMRETLVRHSTAIGFREKEVLRLSLPRKEEAAQTSLGTVREKTVFFEGEALRSKIEFEDRARIAGETGLSLEQAEKRITGEMRNASGN